VRHNAAQSSKENLMPTTKSQKTQTPSDTMIAELLAAWDAKIDIELYLRARKVGISHTETMAAAVWDWGEGDPLTPYLSARTRQMTHAQATKLARLALTPDNLATALVCSGGRATYDEIVEVLEHKTLVPETLTFYLLSRPNGTAPGGSTHAEVMEIIDSGGDLANYALSINYGVAHTQITEALRDGTSIKDFAIQLVV
jgi:hypothetical protein